MMMQLSPEQGTLLHWLATTLGAKRILELGVFTGYSSICMATALPPDGKLLACDIDDGIALQIARKYWAKANVTDLVRWQRGNGRHGEDVSWGVGFLRSARESRECQLHRVQCVVVSSVARVFSLVSPLRVPPSSLFYPSSLHLTSRIGRPLYWLFLFPSPPRSRSLPPLPSLFLFVQIEEHIRPGAETLNQLLDEGQAGTFDLIFVDADKGGYPTYYELGLKLLRPGGVIAFDNMLFHGRVVDPKDNSKTIQGIREVNDRVFLDDRVTPVLLATGDGMVIATKK